MYRDRVTSFAIQIPIYNVLFIKQINESCCTRARTRTTDVECSRSTIRRVTTNVQYRNSAVHGFNDFHSPSTLFFRFPAMSSPFSIRQVLLTRLVFTGKTDVYRFILARKALGVAFNVLSRGSPPPVSRRKRDRFSVNIPSTCRDSGATNLYCLSTGR